MLESDPNAFVFDGAQKILGITESHGKKEIEVKLAHEQLAYFKMRQEKPYDLKHGTVRFS